MKQIIYTIPEKETMMLNNEYKEILKYYKNYLIHLKIQDFWEFFYTSTILILEGYFSATKKLIRNGEYPLAKEMILSQK